MMTSMRPPRIPTPFSKKRLSLFPKHTPRNDNRNVTVPITIIGVAIGAFNKAKLSPTAKASILVATDNISKLGILKDACFFSSDFAAKAQKSSLSQ